MPDGFSPFRKKIEKALKPYDSTNNIVNKPESFLHNFADIVSEELPELLSFNDNEASMKHRGGELAAKEQLNYYSFKTKQLSQYKETRNGLDGWDFSSKLSAYLAHGCISPRQVMKTVIAYESQFGSNQSTY